VSEDWDFETSLRYFFQEYLSRHRGVSTNTIASYKTTFQIFVPWLSRYTGKSQPEIKDCDPLAILEFLRHIEEDRGNTAVTRNVRMAALKSFVKMLTIMTPANSSSLSRVLRLQGKKTQSKVVDYFDHDDAIKIIASARSSGKYGDRDATILTLLYDAGLRASELTSLNVDSHCTKEQSLGILGKGNKYRRIRVWPQTSALLSHYVANVRRKPKPAFTNKIFINENRESFSRSGIYKICARSLRATTSIKEVYVGAKRSPVHSWRHSAAVRMLREGFSILEVQVRLGHAQSSTTLKYLEMDLSMKRARIKELAEYSQKEFVPTLSSSKAPESWSSEKQVIDFLKKL